jgi:tetratricopeptide (TPR) repeat protein
LNSLASWTSGYYSAAYLNPYYATPVATVPVYDYSQPIVVQTYVTADPGQAPADAAAAEPALTPEQQQAYQLFDQARAAFANNDNGRALSLIEEALRLTPGDPIMHEFRALCLFALGDYRNAAAVLNALLAVAPGWDWTTMSSLYGNTTYYTDQLRNLESYCRQNPTDPASHFVLAYHYLILGHDESAVRALEVVTTQQPEDVVASRMLEALTGPPEPPPRPPHPPRRPNPPRLRPTSPRPMTPTTTTTPPPPTSSADGGPSRTIRSASS